MSKIICDVCGTSYAETATQCPICGCVRSADASPIAGNVKSTTERNNGSYAYVKGGRFSKANVRKRNASGTSEATETSVVSDDVLMEKSRNDKGLVIAVILLLLAIIAVVIYISVRFFGPSPEEKPDDSWNDKHNSVSDTQKEDEQENDETPVEIPCISLVVSDVTVSFDEVGKTLQLEVTPQPADTTDPITFSSDNKTIADVDEKGVIVAMASGKTIIRIKCGDAEVQCSVVCDFESSENTDKDEEQNSDINLTLRKNDITLFVKGEKFDLSTGDIPAADIQWSTSDTDVATVADGVVTMVGNSFTGDYATITATYRGVKKTCIVRWGGRTSGVPGNGNVSEAN